MVKLSYNFIFLSVRKNTDRKVNTDKHAVQSTHQYNLHSDQDAACPAPLPSTPEAPLCPFPVTTSTQQWPLSCQQWRLIFLFSNSINELMKYSQQSLKERCLLQHHFTVTWVRNKINSQTGPLSTQSLFCARLLPHPKHVHYLLGYESVIPV